MIEIDLAQIAETILACPNDPDDVKKLTEVANTKIDDVFLGSCMTNIGHFRAAGEIWKGQKFNPAVRDLDLPAHPHGPAAAQGRGLLLDLHGHRGAHRDRRLLALHGQPGARAGRGEHVLHLDAQLRRSHRERRQRVPRLGRARRGDGEPRPAPTPAEYFAAYQEKIAPRAAQVYRYLQFDELAEYKPAKGRTVA